MDAVGVNGNGTAQDKTAVDTKGILWARFCEWLKWHWMNCYHRREAAG